MYQKETKTCQNCKNQFIIEPADFEFYEKIKVPAPTFCVDCREQRRIAFRNERSLYKRKCDLCGQSVVSRVSPDKPYKMYCAKCWWSDKWDALEYGKDYDFSKPFFEQFKELLLSTPHISLQNSNTVNSDWVNQETDDKNCYLNVGGHYNEDSAYDTYSLYGKSIFDSYWIFNSEFGYKNINCDHCYKAFFSRDCVNCQETVLSSDCRGCSYIFGCSGLRNKQYHIFNKPYSKEEYLDFVKNNKIGVYGNFKKLKEKAEEIRLSVPKRYAFVFKSVNCTGHLISESKNSQNCWALEKSEDSKNIFIGGWSKDCYDLTSHGGTELNYECAHGGGVYNCRFLAYSMAANPLQGTHSSNLEYCYAAISSNNCFGCANLRNKEYCVLNKQYTKEEYEELVTRIKEQMNKTPYIDKRGRVYKYGEFFPVELSPFGYNETAAMDYFPLAREQAIERGYQWCDYESQNKYEFSDYEIPDDINNVKDDILTKILKCEVSGKPYKIIPMELDFYWKMGLPIPRRAPLQRHKDRIAQLLPRKLYDRRCMCQGQTANGKEQIVYTNTSKHFHGENPCPNEIKTPYSPDRSEIVYCESCYNSEVV